MVLYALNSSVNVNVRHLYARKRFASSGPSVPWRENKYLDSSSFALPQVILHLLIYYNNLSIHTKKGAAINPFMAMSGPVGLVVWFSLRVREVPGSTPGQALFDKHVKWKTKLLSYFNRPKRRFGGELSDSSLFSFFSFALFICLLLFVCFFVFNLSVTIVRLRINNINLKWYNNFVSLNWCSKLIAEPQ